MEERYDGDTVELIDYLRVMWWGKWIILGCFVVAVGLSALLVGLKPTTYSGSTELLFREYVSSALAGDQDAAIAVTVASTRALAAVENEVDNIAASLKNGCILLARSSATSHDSVNQALSQASIALEQLMLIALAEEMKSLAYEMQLQMNLLTAQLEILQQRFAKILTAVENPLASALAAQIAELEASLAEKQVRMEVLENVAPGDLFTLSILGPPAITASGSRLKTTVAVATFLGLMIGILLAFFVHYLLQIQAKEREETAAKHV